MSNKIKDAIKYQPGDTVHLYEPFGKGHVMEVKENGRLVIALLRGSTLGGDGVREVSPDEVYGEKSAAPVNTSPWMPIESAPRDGTEILLLSLDGECLIGQYLERPLFGKTWTHHGGSINVEGASHWMPLPTPILR